MTKAKAKSLKATADKKTSEVAEPYKPTEREQKSIDAHDARHAARAPLASFRAEMKHKAGDKPTLSIRMDHEDEVVAAALIGEAIKSSSWSYFEGAILSLSALTHGQEDSTVQMRELNHLVSLVAGVEPRDQMESMLAVQMAAVHQATMVSAKRFSIASNIEQRESAERAFNKLARTFTTQMEALKRYRSKGEQRVYVERVTVNDGGQAVVGNVTHGGGGNGKSVG